MPPCEYMLGPVCRIAKKRPFPFGPRFISARHLSKMVWPAKVKVVEVGPRDGLQNEPGTIPTSVKVDLIDRLANAGCRDIEAASFVSSTWVPQMADGKEVMRGIHRLQGVTYSALTPNMKGLEAAIEAGADEVAVFGAASEAFSRANINCSIDDCLERFQPVCKAAASEGIPVRGYISCVLGCPYQGEVPPEDAVKVARSLLDMGCYEVSLGDTIGVGTAGSTRNLLESMWAAGLPKRRFAVHFHDTYGQALANVLIALQQGVSVVDASVSGLGGCPYARGASGNLATEDLVYMLHGMGVETGIDLDLLLDVSARISAALERAPSSKAARALLAKMEMSQQL